MTTDISQESRYTEKGNQEDPYINNSTIEDEKASNNDSKGETNVNTADADYSRNKFIVLRKSEILANQYRGNIILTTILLFSAFCIGYGYGLDGNVRYIFTGYATSAYGTHSLISTIGVINAVIGAASQVVYARLSDIFGRLELLILAVVFYVVGTIIQSQAYDIQRYCAGAVFYNLGYVGVLLIVLLILSDFSSLRWRLFYQFIPTLPFIINTWISGNVTSSVGPVEHWSWGIGMWAFIFPLTSLPLIGCILHMRFLAGKTEEWKEVSSEKTFYQSHGIVKSIQELFWRVDFLGVALLTVALGCLLVPLTLAGGLSSKWSSGKIIGPLVLGIVLLPIWVLYESRFAKYPMAPFKLLRDRGVWAALALSFLLDFIYYMAYDYLYVVLIVAVNQSTASATRITSISSFVSVVWAPVFALIVVYVKKLKIFIMLGTATWFLATGLLYHFRGGESSKSGIIGALVVWGAGTTLFSYPLAVSVQSVTSHENMATVTALCYVLYRVGSAVGNSVSGAIWTQLLPKKLEKTIGNATLAVAAYGSPYTFILDYPWGTPEREAVVEAYRYIQRLETLVALCFCILLFGFSFFLRDAPLTDDIAHNELPENELIYKKHADPVYEWITGIFGRKNKSTQEEPVSSQTNQDTEEIAEVKV